MASWQLMMPEARSYRGAGSPRLDGELGSLAKTSSIGDEVADDLTDLHFMGNVFKMNASEQSMYGSSMTESTQTEVEDTFSSSDGSLFNTRQILPEAHASKEVAFAEDRPYSQDGLDYSCYGYRYGDVFRAVSPPLRPACWAGEAARLRTGHGGGTPADDEAYWGVDQVADETHWAEGAIQQQYLENRFDGMGGKLPSGAELLMYHSHVNEATLPNSIPSNDLNPKWIAFRRPDNNRSAYGTLGRVEMTHTGKYFCASDRPVKCPPGVLATDLPEPKSAQVGAHRPPPGLSEYEDSHPPVKMLSHVQGKEVGAAAAVRGELPKQVLVVCMETVEDSDIMEEITAEFRHQKYFHFRNAVKFTRWLFEQHRGTLRPWSILVAGWREAKPCMVALEAAYSGDVSKVRPDARRAGLRKPTGGKHAGRKPVKIAVAAMVIVLEDPHQQLERAQMWAAITQGNVPGLEIRIVQDCGKELGEALTSLRRSMARKPISDVAAEAAEGDAVRPKVEEMLQYVRISI